MDVKKSTGDYKVFSDTDRRVCIPLDAWNVETFFESGPRLCIITEHAHRVMHINELMKEEIDNWIKSEMDNEKSLL